MIIPYPDNGLFNETHLSLYEKNKGGDLYTTWTSFDSFLYGNGLYEWRKKQERPGISDKELRVIIERKNSEFSLIEYWLKEYKIKFIIESEGLVDFIEKGIIEEYNVSCIPGELRKSTVSRVIDILKSYNNYQIAITENKLPFFYDGGGKAGIILLRREFREKTGICAFFSEDDKDAQLIKQRFEELWENSINDKTKVIDIMGKYFVR